MRICKKTAVLALAAVFAAAVCCCLPAGCAPPAEINPYGIMDESDYLKVVGTEVRDERGEGDPVFLRGTNAGGYLVIEQWMTAITNGDGPYCDHKRVDDAFTARFGADGAAALWAEYRRNYWTDDDFARCAEMGMTALRLPFSYMNVDFGGVYDFTVLDDFVYGAAKYGMYTILDLHGAYGSQNGKDHSGEIVEDYADVDFYRNEDKIERTCRLWSALAAHFRGNPCVAAFDLLNEPGEHAGTTGRRHWDVFDRLYDAVRAEDTDRIVIFEACWDAVNLPRPETYGWENCMYSYHQYAGTENGTSVTVQGPTYLQKIINAEQAHYGVPNYMGEFNCYDDAPSWRYALELMNGKGWHWTSWAYKTNIDSPWGIYNTAARRVDPYTDSRDAMTAKWTEIATDRGSLHVMPGGETLAEIIEEACRWEAATE